MKVAIYARVSTDRQESLNQIADLREFARVRGYEVVSEYVDADVSGKVERKPQLEVLLTDAHQGRFEVVVFWSFDRLTRRGPDDAARRQYARAPGCAAAVYPATVLGLLYVHRSEPRQLLRHHTHLR